MYFLEKSFEANGIHVYFNRLRMSYIVKIGEESSFRNTEEDEGGMV